MLQVVVILHLLLLLALFIEIVFRSIGQFSAEAREFFRWVYIAGCGGTALTGIIAMLRRGGLFGNTPGSARWYMAITIAVAAVVIALRLSRKDKEVK